MKRRALAAACVVGVGVMLGVARVQPSGAETREVELRREIVQKYEEVFRRERVKIDAGLLDHGGLVGVHAQLTEARVGLARALADADDERAALSEHLSLLRHNVEEVRSRLFEAEPSDLLRAEIAVLECEIALERLGEG